MNYQTAKDHLGFTAFVVSRVIKNTKLSHEVLEALKQYELPVLNSYTTQRVVYPTSAKGISNIYVRMCNMEKQLTVIEVRDKLISLGIYDFTFKGHILSTKNLKYLRLLLKEYSDERAKCL